MNNKTSLGRKEGNRELVQGLPVRSEETDPLTTAIWGPHTLGVVHGQAGPLHSARTPRCRQPSATFPRSLPSPSVPTVTACRWGQGIPSPDAPIQKTGAGPELMPTGCPANAGASSPFSPGKALEAGIPVNAGGETEARGGQVPASHTAGKWQSRDSNTRLNVVTGRDVGSRPDSTPSLGRTFTSRSLRIQFYCFVSTTPVSRLDPSLFTDEETEAQAFSHFSVSGRGGTWAPVGRCHVTWVAGLRALHQSPHCPQNPSCSFRLQTFARTALLGRGPSPALTSPSKFTCSPQAWARASTSSGRPSWAFSPVPRSGPSHFLPVGHWSFFPPRSKASRRRA